MPSQAEEPEYPPSLAIRRAKMSLLLLSAFSFLLYVVWKVIYTLYNRHFHPLRHYPGPFLATISRLPYARAYILGQLHTYVSSLHELYGDVVRVAPDELSFRTEQAWNDIYSFPTDFPKDPRFFNVGKSGASNLGVAPTKEVHRRQRRVLGGAFSDMALKHQEPLLQGYVDILIKTMYNKARAESKIDVVEWYNYTTFDFMAEYVYGESLSCLKDARCHPFIGMKFVSVKAWTIISMSKYLPSLSYLIKAVAWYLHGDLFRNRETNAQFNKSKIAERMSSDRDSSKKDYITHVRSSQGPKGSLSEDEIHANASFLMIAGSETTATTLSGCTFLLLARPDAYQELTCQIRLRYQNSSDITFASMTDFPYLDAVLQEALRMYPATPLGMPRIVPEGGAMISGTFVPGKTAVSVPHYASYRSTANFSNPNTFLPERWIAQEKAEYAKDRRGVLRPFSAGPRNCLGQSLGKAMVKLILVKLLWHFELFLCPESSVWAEQQAFVVWNKNPLLIQFVARNRKS